MSFGDFSEQILEVHKWAVSSSSSTVHVVWAAVPVDLRAASGGALCSLTLLLGCHLGQLLLGSNKGTVSSGSGTVHIVWAAVPVDLWAASGRAFCSITLLIFKFEWSCLG